MPKTVLVTGASRGIGYSTAKLFAESGYQTVINYNNSKDEAEILEKTLTDSGYAAFAVKADVSERCQVENMISLVKNRFESVDILINNAGIAQQKLFSDITSEDFNKMFSVNVTGTYHCIQSVLPDMINKKSGVILNISSVWGITGASCEVHYSAAKAAIIGMSKALAKEVGPSGIRVNCVAPGVIATDMVNSLSDETRAILKEETPLSKIGTALDIAETLLFLSSDHASFITGQVISPNGGFCI